MPFALCLKSMFVYKAVTSEGKITTGLIDAKTLSDAASSLRKHDLTPITINVKKQATLDSIFSFRNSIGEKDVIFFTRQLSSMLSSGLTLMQALGVLRNQVEKSSMKDMITKVVTDIEDGSKFSTALKKHPKVFSPIYISLITAGETSGLLDKILLRLADTLEKDAKLKGEIKSAMMYPLIVIILMVLVTFVMMITVIPQLSSLFTQLNVELPLPTLILITTSKFTVAFWPFMIAIVVGAVYGFKRWYGTPEGKLAVDKTLLKVPIMGTLIRMNIMTQYSRTLGLLIGSGSLVVESLRQTADIVGNKVYQDAILALTKKVEKGVGVGKAMASSEVFPPLLVQLTEIGEQTGKLDDSLTRASEYYEREVDQLVKTLTTAMEPIIMLVLGSGVAFLLIAVITPIYKLTSAF